MDRIKIGAALAVALAASPASVASAQYSNAQIRQMLEAKDTKFEVDSDNDFKIVIEWTKEKRSQLVYVASRTETLNGMPIREIFSPAANLTDSKISGERALDLLKDASTNKIGGWQISGNALYYVIMLPEPFTADALDSAINVAAETADNEEIKISGKADKL